MNPRDLIGYGATPPDARWPNGARVAVQFVINYEEGAENSVLNGDAGSEAFLSEMVGAASHPARAMAMESLYEYGSRAGFWRLHRLFTEAKAPVTVFGVAYRQWLAEGEERSLGELEAEVLAEVPALSLRAR